MWKSNFEATGDQWRKFEITGTQPGNWEGGKWSWVGSCGKEKVERSLWKKKTKSMKLQWQTIVLLQNYYRNTDLSSCFM